MVAMNPDRLAALEEERKFLLLSLEDLERERAAVDIDDVDYEGLKDGYTVRAAATMRAIDEGRSSLPTKPPPNWGRRLLVGVVVIAAVGIVWWALAASSAQRLPGQEITGLDPRTERQTLLVQARAIQGQDPAQAAELYAEVLEGDPDNVEAMTYRGWTLALSSLVAPDEAAAVRLIDEGVDLLVLAIETDSSYPDPFCFLGIVEFRFGGDAVTAKPFIDGCLAANPPADVRDLVGALAVEIDEQLAG